MFHTFENALARLWNSARPVSKSASAGMRLGSVVRDGIVTSEQVFLAHSKRAEHIATTGRTGSGKTNLVTDCQAQDVRTGLGLCASDLHNDITPFLLRTIAAEEHRMGRDLSERTILIDPTDPTYSVGVPILEGQRDKDYFRQVAEFTAILKRRWELGARTDELLLHATEVAAEADLTPLEIPQILTSAAFRAQCLRRVSNREVCAYFESRYNVASAAMQAAMAAPVLNKLTAFSANPQFRHLFGQRHSTFSLADAMDNGFWIILHLPKGNLGEDAPLIGALLVRQILNQIFARRTRRLFTLYLDEIQNFVTTETGLEILLSEARKFGVGVVSANQYLDQFPAQIRSAMDAIGTHIYFQLSPADATQIAAALDGGKSLAGLLKNLPRGEFVLKTGSESWIRVRAPRAIAPEVDYSDLRRRCLERWARKRSDIEREIRTRQAVAHGGHSEALNGWE